MAGFIFLKLNNHEICQNTALWSEFPLFILTWALTIEMSCHKNKLCRQKQQLSSAWKFSSQVPSVPGLQQWAGTRAGLGVPPTRRKVQKPECHGKKGGEDDEYLFYRSNLSVGSGICTNGSLSSL